MKLILNKKYNPLFSSDARYFIITGGRGSGKSFAVTVFLTLLTMTKGIRILFTRYTMTSAHLSIIPEFLEKIGLLGFDEVFSINKAEVVNTSNQSDILFRGIRTSVETGDSQLTYNFQVFIMDMVSEKSDWQTKQHELLTKLVDRENNEQEVFNQTLAICTDIIGMLRHSSRQSIEGVNDIKRTYLLYTRPIYNRAVSRKV